MRKYLIDPFHFLPNIRYCLLVFFFLAVHFSYSKDKVYVSPKDSLKQAISEEFPNASVKKLLELAGQYSGSSLEKALAAGDLATEQARATQDHEGLFNAYRDCGFYCELHGRFDKALELYRKALKASESIDKPFFKLVIYNDLAITYRKLGKYKSTKDYHLLALELAEQSGDLENMENAYHGLGFLYETVSDFDEAIRYYFLSLEMAEKRKAQKGIVVTMQNISKTYVKSDNKEKAITTIKEAYELAAQTKDTILLANVLHDYGEILTEIGDYNQALKKLQNALEIYRIAPANYSIPRSLVYIGDVYLKMEQPRNASLVFNEALAYKDYLVNSVAVHLHNQLGVLHLQNEALEKAELEFKTALEKAEKDDLKSYSVVSYENLYQIEEIRNNYQKAFEYLKKVNELKHDILSQEKSKRIAELQFQYDVAKGERALQALKLRQNKLLLAGSSILFIVLITFLVYTNRIRAKSNNNLVQKNQEIQQQNVKLKESNEVLQQFAYVAAHDLKEPLRSIGSFINLIQRKYGQQFNEEANEYMNFVRSATFRMNNLVTALLEYSTISIQKPSDELIDTQHVVSDVLNNLQDVIITKNAKVEVAALPKVAMNPLHTAQLFQNLIGNALKFSKETPRVVVSAEEKPHHITFSIQDNGIGMNEEYSDKVFKLFHQLNKNHGAEGTGIGLTICKNIVDKYNGKIWFSSKEGFGTTFFVELPR